MAAIALAAVDAAPYLRLRGFVAWLRKRLCDVLFPCNLAPLLPCDLLCYHVDHPRQGQQFLA